MNDYIAELEAMLIEKGLRLSITVPIKRQKPGLYGEAGPIQCLREFLDQIAATGSPQS